MLKDIIITLDTPICECCRKTGKYEYNWNMVCDEKSILELVIHCKVCRTVQNFSKDLVKAKIVVDKNISAKDIKKTIESAKKKLDAIDEAVSKLKTKKKFDKPN